jgi:anti-sigma B factor antagonist
MLWQEHLTKLRNVDWLFVICPKSNDRYLNQIMQQRLTKPKIVVIRPPSCLDATTAKKFTQELAIAITQDNCSTLVVDLGQVKFLDSTGLMALVSGLKLAEKLERRLRLCSISPAIKIIFELTQLDEIFEVFDSQLAHKSTAS